MSTWLPWQNTKRKQSMYSQPSTSFRDIQMAFAFSFIIIYIVYNICYALMLILWWSTSRWEEWNGGRSKYEYICAHSQTLSSCFYVFSPILVLSMHIPHPKNIMEYVLFFFSGVLIFPQLNAIRAPNNTSLISIGNFVVDLDVLPAQAFQ